MKLIIQITDGTIYAYRESDAHFAAVEPNRKTPLYRQERLDEDCDLSNYGEGHWVFDLKDDGTKTTRPRIRYSITIDHIPGGSQLAR